MRTDWRVVVFAGVLFAAASCFNPTCLSITACAGGRALSFGGDDPLGSELGEDPNIEELLDDVAASLE